MEKIRFLGFMAIIILLAMMAFGTSCKPNTKPKFGSVVGTVILANDSGDPANDPIDFTGVTVALYELAKLDTTLVRINGEYPQIGVMISQETEFDHRSHEPLHVTQSNADGSFEIEEIEPGVYNVVILREGWGVKYIYEIEIVEGEAGDLGTVELYPVREYSQYAGEEQLFRAGHTYLINESTVFAFPVEIEPGALICVSPGVGVTFHGNVGTSSTEPDSLPWKIQSAKDMYAVTKSEISADEFFGSLQFNGTQTDICGGIIQHFMNSVALRSDSNIVVSVIFRDYEDGVALLQGSGAFRNLLCARGVSEGLNLNTPQSGVTEVSRCIFSSVNWGVNIRVGGTYDVNNCYFTGNIRAVVSDLCTGSITHNAFDKNRWHVTTKTAVSPQISYNNFYHSYQYSVFPVARAVINDNNFFTTDEYFISIRDPNPPEYSSVYEDLDATNNYWAVQNLDDYLLDASDNAQYPSEPCAYFVLYHPRRGSRVAEAGIQ